MSVDDAQWAAKLMEQRRSIYERYSPVFWRPTPNFAGAHATFLQSQIERAEHVAVRSDHGFCIVELRGSEFVVDDFAVRSDRQWQSDGAQLLLEAWARLRTRRVDGITVVTAEADIAKCRMLSDLSLRLVQAWWVKPLDAVGNPTRPFGRVEGSGFSGFFGLAPPVYSPGGPVLLVDAPQDTAISTPFKRRRRRWEQCWRSCRPTRWVT
ncbi:MAG: hypothetical protein ACRDVW_07995 [Acidimicrobiales bacterium]